MYKKFIAAISAASLTISLFAGAAPARADADDVAKALAGIAAIAIIGKAISDNNKRKQDHVTRNSHHHNPAPRPVPQRFSRYDLPGHCLVDLNLGRQGAVRMFSKRCLQQNYRFSHDLPNVCEQRFWTDRGTRRGYSPRCLRESGYRISRNR